MKYIKKLVLIWSGLCSIAVGIAGLVLPVIPGLVFIFIGLLLLSRGSSTLRNVFIMQMIIKKTKEKIENSENQIFKKLLILL